MDHVFWLVSDKLAGRPGPDRAPWDLDVLRRGGIGAVLSVNDGMLCHPEEFAARDIAYACVPLSANAPPLPGDDELCLQLLPLADDFVQAQLASGRVTVVHCSSGKDRTGLFLAYWLVKNAGLSPAEAALEVRRVRPIALSAPGWWDFALDVLGRAG